MISYKILDIMLIDEKKQLENHISYYKASLAHNPLKNVYLNLLNISEIKLKTINELMSDLNRENIIDTYNEYKKFKSENQIWRFLI